MSTTKQRIKDIQDIIEQSAEMFGEYLSISLSALFLLAAHKVTSWDYPLFDFIKDQEFDNLLWIVDISIGVSILHSLITIATPKKSPFKKIMQIVENLINIAGAYLFFTRFPYDFTKVIDIEWINTGAKALIGLVIFGLTVGTITEFVKLLTENPNNAK
jgi:hypothetical protein